MGKLLDLVFSASGAILSLCLIAFLASRRSPSVRWRGLAIAAAIFYALAGLAVVPYVVGHLLAAGYHQLAAEEVPAGRTAIVLLGGGDVFIQGWTDSLTVTTPVEAQRVLEAARVFRLISPAWIISSGGKPSPDEPGRAEQHDDARRVDTTGRAA